MDAEQKSQQERERVENQASVAAMSPATRSDATTIR